MRPRNTRKRIATVTLVSLILSPSGLVGAGPFMRSTSTQGTAAQKPTATPAAKPVPPPATPAPVDGTWPRRRTTPSGGALALYQPQIASWEDQKRMTLFSAVLVHCQTG